MKIKRVPTCHPERKHMAKGLCGKCYARQWHEANRDHVRQWKEANRDSVREGKRRRYAANRERECARGRRRRAADPDRARKLSRERNRRWREAHPDRAREIVSRWYAANPDRGLEFVRRYQAAHRERVLERVRQWNKAHPEEMRSIKQRRRARLRDSCSPGVTPAEWRGILEAFGHACAYCGARGKLTRDHVVPIARGGRDEPENVVPACTPCNSRKGARTAEEFADYLERVA